MIIIGLVKTADSQPEVSTPSVKVRKAPIPSAIQFLSNAHALRFSRDGKKLLVAKNDYRELTSTNALSGRADSRLRVYDPLSGKMTWTLPARATATGPILLMPNFKIMVNAFGGYKIWRIDVHSGQRREFFPVNCGSISSLTLSPDEKLMAIGMTRGVEIRDARTRKLLRDYSHGGQRTRVRYGPRGKTILCTWPKGVGRPQCFSVKTIKQIRWPRWVYRVQNADAWVFSSDGNQLALARGKRVEIWKTPGENDGGKRLRTFHALLERTDHLAFSPDGRTLAAGGLSRDQTPVQFFALR